MTDSPLSQLVVDVSDVLKQDLDFFVDLLSKDIADQILRRMYARTFIAYVESVLSSLKTAVVEEIQDCSLSAGIRFTDAEKAMLEEKSFELSNKGEAISRPYFASIDRNLKFTFTAYARAFKLKFQPNLGDHKWDSFLKSVTIRNRITHPKSIPEMTITDEELIILNDGYKWFNENYTQLLDEIIRDLEKSLDDTQQP